MLDSPPTEKHHASMSELDQILANIEQARLSSEKRSQWQPGHVGSIDIRIAADGSWFHEGRPFQRLSLVKLFASVLHRQGDDHFLLTPAEKLKIQVDDAPFVANIVEVIEQDQQSAIVFTTNLDDRILVDNNHPVRVETDPETQTPRPYVHYRDGLDALIGRNAFFELINMASETRRNGQLYLTLGSLGHEFDLGCVEEEVGA